jgi:cellobiose phosphorylase
VASEAKKQGRFFPNTQLWVVISGVAVEKRPESAIDHCFGDPEIATGMQICWLACHRVEDDIGLISRRVPGKK